MKKICKRSKSKFVVNLFKCLGVTVGVVSSNSCGLFDDEDNKTSKRTAKTPNDVIKKFNELFQRMAQSPDGQQVIEKIRKMSDDELKKLLNTPVAPEDATRVWLADANTRPAVLGSIRQHELKDVYEAYAKWENEKSQVNADVFVFRFVQALQDPAKTRDARIFLALDHKITNIEEFSIVKGNDSYKFPHLTQNTQGSDIFPLSTRFVENLHLLAALRSCSYNFKEMDNNLWGALGKIDITDLTQIAKLSDEEVESLKQIPVKESEKLIVKTENTQTDIGTGVKISIGDSEIATINLSGSDFAMSGYDHSVQIYINVYKNISHLSNIFSIDKSAVVRLADDIDLTNDSNMQSRFLLFGTNPVITSVDTIGEQLSFLFGPIASSDVDENGRLILSNKQGITISFASSIESLDCQNENVSDFINALKRLGVELTNELPKYGFKVEIPLCRLYFNTIGDTFCLFKNINFGDKNNLKIFAQGLEALMDSDFYKIGLCTATYPVYNGSRPDYTYSKAIFQYNGKIGGCFLNFGEITSATFSTDGDFEIFKRVFMAMAKAGYFEDVDPNVDITDEGGFSDATSRSKIQYTKRDGRPSGPIVISSS